MKKIILVILSIASYNADVISAQAPIGKADSYCTFAGKKGGNISKREIESANTLVYVGADSTWKVTHFRLSVAAKELPYREFGTDGELLTDEMISYLRRAPVHAKFFIEYIRVGNSNGSRQIAPLSFQIVE